MGTISYSLYLWHWPLIVFQGASGLLAQGLSPKASKLVVLGVSFVAATLSWRFVEQPFRESRKRLPRPRLFQIATAAAAVLAIFAASAVVTRGFPSRYSSQAVRVASYLENADAITEAQYRVGSCFLTSRNPHAQFATAECMKSDPARRNALLIGDSHAAQLWFGLSTVFKSINFMQATASGCKPTLAQPLGADQRCSQLMDYVFQDYLKKHSVDSILIAARWDSADLARLQQTVSFLQQHHVKVILFGPVVQYDSALPRLLAISIQQHAPQLPADHRVAYYEQLDQEMTQVARQLGVPYISYFNLICDHGVCLEYASQDVPLLSDYGHLTGDGSLLVAAKIRMLAFQIVPKHSPIATNKCRPADSSLRRHFHSPHRCLDKCPSAQPSSLDDFAIHPFRKLKSRPRLIRNGAFAVQIPACPNTAAHCSDRMNGIPNERYSGCVDSPSSTLASYPSISILI